MSDFTVILPVVDHQTFGERYDAIFEQLNDRHATVHLVAQAGTVAAATPALNPQQKAQMNRLSMSLKCEALDRLVQALTPRYPNLSFEFHVESRSPDRLLISLCAQLAPQVIVMNRGTLGAEATPINAAVQQLAEAWNIALWSVEPDITGLQPRTRRPMPDVYSGAELTHASARAMPKID
ncbi:hypothetical protein [Reinekea blandensis]|uniref:Uncharacterized protein n=1 Tax=Reinekea blandensis MED297 TaxID=314283 RepID=A4BDK9_9GAMM|nr:hypothetical protein [Reinekea blandensis]EAR09953.1 hypothetical protein MED297_06374 [Reinekea sp. MED297] [Reinekea blandensis MED297]